MTMRERHGAYFHALTTRSGSKLRSIASIFHDLLLDDDHDDCCRFMELERASSSCSVVTDKQFTGWRRIGTSCLSS